MAFVNVCSRPVDEMVFGVVFRDVLAEAFYFVLANIPKSVSISGGII